MVNWTFEWLMVGWRESVVWGVLVWILVKSLFDVVSESVLPHPLTRHKKKKLTEWANTYYAEELRHIEASETLSDEDKRLVVQMLTERPTPLRHDFLMRARDAFYSFGFILSALIGVSTTFMHGMDFATWSIVLSGVVLLAVSIGLLKAYFDIEEKNADKAAPFETALFFRRESDVRDITAFAAKEGISFQNISFHEFTPEIVNQLRLSVIADRWAKVERKLPVHREFLPQPMKRMTDFSEANVQEWTTDETTRALMRDCVNDLRTTLQMDSKTHAVSSS